MAYFEVKKQLNFFCQEEGFVCLDLTFLNIISSSLLLYFDFTLATALSGLLTPIFKFTINI